MGTIAPMRRLGLLLIVLLVAACAAGEQGTASGGAPADQPAATAAGDSPLAFTSTTVAGEAFEGGAYAGQDLMLWFWAPW